MALILREYLESPITTIDNEILNNYMIKYNM